MELQILLVEDDSLLREILQKLLTRNGFNVVSAADGEQALTLLKKEQPKLILLDLVIPGIDGFELLRRIKAESKTALIPVIILSNLGSADDIAKATKLGAAGYWIKSAAVPEEIVVKVRQVLGRATQDNPTTTP